jgi:hypothetical protein
MIGLDLAPMDFAQKKIQGSSLCRKSKRGCHNIYMLYIYIHIHNYTHRDKATMDTRIQKRDATHSKYIKNEQNNNSSAG